MISADLCALLQGLFDYKDPTQSATLSSTGVAEGVQGSATGVLPTPAPQAPQAPLWSTSANANIDVVADAYGGPEGGASGYSITGYPDSHSVRCGCLPFPAFILASAIFACAAAVCFACLGTLLQNCAENDGTCCLGCP